MDGAVFEGIPFRQAIADGCTHLVVLCTRPPFRCALTPLARCTMPYVIDAACCAAEEALDPASTGLSAYGIPPFCRCAFHLSVAIDHSRFYWVNHISGMIWVPAMNRAMSAVSLGPPPSPHHLAFRCPLRLPRTGNCNVEDRTGRGFLVPSSL